MLSHGSNCQNPISVQQRRSDRLDHHVEVRFWTKGEEAVARSGHTKDVSSSGMFISTKSPYPPGTQFLLETVDSPVQLQAEAVVVHYIGTLLGSAAGTGEDDSDFVATASEVDREGWAEFISPFIHRLQPTGMGVRFLQPVSRIHEVLGIDAADKAS